MPNWMPSSYPFGRARLIAVRTSLNAFRRSAGSAARYSFTVNAGMETRLSRELLPRQLPRHNSPAGQTVFPFVVCYSHRLGAAIDGRDEDLAIGLRVGSGKRGLIIQPSTRRRERDPFAVARKARVHVQRRAVGQRARRTVWSPLFQRLQENLEEATRAGRCERNHVT